MELLTFNIAAGETKRFERAGRYLEVFEALSPLSIFLSDRNGGRVDSALGAGSGIYMEGDYSAFEIYSQAAQSITLFVSDGRGGNRRLPGVVSVTNRIGPGVMQPYAAAPLVTGLQTAVVIAPGSNPRGIFVRKVYTSVTVPAAAIGEVRLIAAPTVPVSTSPLNAYNMSAVYVNGPGAASDSRVESYQLPAGWGVWVVTQHVTAPATAADYSLTYELL